MDTFVYRHEYMAEHIEYINIHKCTLSKYVHFLLEFHYYVIHPLYEFKNSLYNMVFKLGDIIWKVSIFIPTSVNRINTV